MIRTHYIFKGRVQGVGFRYTLYQLAHRLKLTGWVRNCDNGSVEACVQGEKALMQLMIEQLYKAPFICIDSIETENLEVLSQEKSFQIKY